MDRSGTAAGESETPEQMLHAVVGQLSHAVESSAYAGSKYEPLGRALVFRLAARSLHVVGDTPLAAEFRRLVTAGAVPGWDLHPGPGDLLTLAPGVADLPPDVARSWDRIRQLGLQLLAGTVLADGDLPGLAQELMEELEERRRLILTSRTFAQTRRTYDSLAAELGVGRERVRQLETSALRQLANAAAHDRYRPLRWRAASAAPPGRGSHSGFLRPCVFTGDRLARARSSPVFSGRL